MRHKHLCSLMGWICSPDLKLELISLVDQLAGKLNSGTERTRNLTPLFKMSLCIQSILAAFLFFNALIDNVTLLSVNGWIAWSIFVCSLYFGECFQECREAIWTKLDQNWFWSLVFSRIYKLVKFVIFVGIRARV